MDFDMFFSSPRWTILDILAKRPSSPLELSQEMGTTVSYVSQQLRLLEAANLIVKERTGNAEKGKPRMIFSLPREMMHLTVLINRLPAKKLIYLTNYHKLVLRIWLLENPELHYPLEKLYWKLEDYLDDIDGLFVTKGSTNPTVYVVSGKAGLKSRVTKLTSQFKGVLQLRLITTAAFNKLSKTELHPIYDPGMLYLEEQG